jgi:hypothetical protein
MQGVDKMNNNIKVLVIKEHGNPRNQNMISQQGNRFIIKPFIEDDNPNYKCRMDVKIVNRSDKFISVPLTIDWGPQDDTELYRYVVLNTKEDEWVKINGEGENGKVNVVVEVPPGCSRLSMHPPYDYDRLIRLLGSLPKDIFTVKVIGKSYNSREIFAVEAGIKDKRPLVILTRVHPYETIGSYFADGMIKWLMGQNEDARGLLSKHRLAFIPMPNPDGVVEGYCRTTIGKLDLSYVAGSKEPEAVALISYVKDINAKANFDLHGFMYNYERFRSNDGLKLGILNKRFLSMPELFNKEINAFNDEFPPNGKEINLGGFVVNKLGGIFFNSSWSWYDRNADHLRLMGIEILKGYADSFENE